jgi:hypothetical protein
MTKTYIATIHHHSIARARSITVRGDLTAAKRAATAEFGDEQRGYVLYIANSFGEPAASRRLSAKRWTNY